jgi:hypothetical protein
VIAWSITTTSRARSCSASAEVRMSSATGCADLEIARPSWLSRYHWCISGGPTDPSWSFAVRREWDTDPPPFAHNV